MVSERMRRNLDAFLDAAEAASHAGEWPAVAEKARAVLALEPDNADALGFLAMAEANGASAALRDGTSPSASDLPLSTVVERGPGGEGSPADPAPLDTARLAELAAAAERSGNPLDRLEEGVFVGRARELDRLRSALDEAVEGRGAVVMLVGEPGIGKTRTTQELEAYARGLGAQVLWGRTHESGGAPPYFPWRLIAQGYRAQNADEVRRKEWEPYAVELQRIFPALRDLFPHLPEPPAVDSQEGQFRLFEAMSGFLRDVSHRVPLLLVLDDLHWADRPTLQLLTHFAQDLAHARVLVLGTYRDTDLDRTHPLSQTLAELNRGQLFSRIALRGLSRDETGAYIRAVAHVEPGNTLIDRIHEDTEGNPFFLSEVVNLLTQEGTLTSTATNVAIPEGVKEALGRRLDRLSPEANELLQLAAVVGREFEHALLVALTAQDDETVLRLEEEALASRVIQESGAVGQYRFTHALMQETLVAELSAARQVRMHGQIAEAMERQYGERADANAVTLASHYAESALLNRAHAQRAVHYLVRAARDAEAQFGWAEAAKQYERAVTLMDESQGVEFAEDIAEVLASAGWCALYATQYRDFWRATMRALDLYRARDDGINFARTSLILNAMVGSAPMPRVVPIWEEALDLLGDRHDALWASVAAELDDPQATPIVQADAAGIAFRRARALDIAERLGQSVVLSDLQCNDAIRAIQDGDFDGATAMSRLARAGLTDTRAVVTTYMIEVYAEQVAGRLDRAASAARTVLDMALQFGNTASAATYSSSLVALHAARDDVAEVADLESRFGDSLNRGWSSRRAWRAFMQGDVEGALDLLPRAEEAGGVPLILVQVHGVRARIFGLLRRDDEQRVEYGAQVRALATLGVKGLQGGSAVTGRDAGIAEWFSILVDGLDRVVDGSDREALRTIVHEPQGLFGALSVAAGPSPSLQRLFGDYAIGLDMPEDADRLYRDALAWCQREGCPIEEGRCWQGLAEIAERRGEHLEALECLDKAGVLFAAHGAKFFLDQVVARQAELRG